MEINFEDLIKHIENEKPQFLSPFLTDKNEEVKKKKINSKNFLKNIIIF